MACAAGEFAGGAVTLVCVPYAGGRPGVFAPLARAFADVNVLAVQLPGHGQRIRERPLTSMADIVRGLAPAVTQAVQGKYVLFGHSMGALVGVELVRAMQEAGAAEPDHFIASACRAPRDLRRGAPWHKLPEDELIAALIALGAEPEPFQIEELREFVLSRVAGRPSGGRGARHGTPYAAAVSDHRRCRYPGFRRHA